MATATAPRRTAAAKPAAVVVPAQSTVSLTAEQALERAYSQLDAMESLNNASGNAWLSGLKHSTYTEVYDSVTGKLKTFLNNNADPAKVKIAGRYVVDAMGVERKLYNGFLDKLAGLAGVTVEDVVIPAQPAIPATADTEAVEAQAEITFKFTSVKNATFGIFAVESLVDSNQPKPDGSGFYKRIDHTLQRTATQARPEPATV